MTVTTGRGRESETERVGEVNRKRKGGREGEKVGEFDGDEGKEWERKQEVDIKSEGWTEIENEKGWKRKTEGKNENMRQGDTEGGRNYLRGKRKRGAVQIGRPRADSLQSETNRGKRRLILHLYSKSKYIIANYSKNTRHNNDHKTHLSPSHLTLMLPIRKQATPGPSAPPPPPTSKHSQLTDRLFSSDRTRRWWWQTHTGFVFCADAELVVCSLHKFTHSEAGLRDLNVLTGREPAWWATHPHLHHIVEDGVASIIVRWKPFQGDVLLGDINGFWFAGSIRFLCKRLHNTEVYISGWCTHWWHQWLLVCWGHQASLQKGYTTLRCEKRKQRREKNHFRRMNFPSKESVAKIINRKQEISSCGCPK